QLAEIQGETLRLIDEHGSLTLAQFRDHFGSSRKYAQAVLEYFDQQRITRRVGDARVRGSA
ncbi:MAG TPA: SelB C-terminal domain-containing protein, partial [Thermomicrobiales bacterium]|nr:SelB C-terminal domain-containing protein [Thermomicrobiales bacterium]